MVTTLRAQAALICDLLNENYCYVIPARFQSDPIEKRFSQYRQMSGGNFLVSLKEVQDTEKILVCKSLMREQIDFWEKDLFCKNDISPQMLHDLEDHMQSVDVEDLILVDDSQEVGVFIAGYIANKIHKKLNCTVCHMLLQESSTDSIYFNNLSRGNLTIPCPQLSNFVCKGFGLLDHFEDFIQSQQSESVRLISSSILHSK